MLSKAKIQLIKSLSDKKTRYETGFFVVEGCKMVCEAVASGASVHSIYFVGEPCDGLPMTLAEEVSGKDMERMSHLKTATNILALVKMPSDGSKAVIYGVDSLALFLDGVQDPGNMGTIIRVADWFGVENIVCSPDCADCYNPKVVQASMGALFRVKVHYAQLPQLLENMVAKDVVVYGTFLEGDDMYDAPLTSNGIVVMGSEGRGISKDVAKFVTNKLFIPPYPAGRQGSESLNVAVATAVVCAEFRRRR